MSSDDSNGNSLVMIPRPSTARRTPIRRMGNANSTTHVPQTPPKPAESFPKFLTLASEIRSKIYKFVFPYDQQLILDPHNIHHPSCFQPQEYGDTYAVLQICKQIRNEALPLLYWRNTFTIIKPDTLADDPDPLENAIGSKALFSIRSLELNMSKGIDELGWIWEEIVLSDKIEQLKLTYYHGDALSWLKQTAQFTTAIIRSKIEDNCIDHLKNPDAFNLRLELFDSIGVPNYQAATYTQKMQEYSGRALRRGRVFSFSLPSSLKKIIIAASVSTHAAFAFATYRQDGWRFNVPSGPSSDSRLKKTLVWEQENTHLRDTVLYRGLCPNTNERR